MIFGDFHRQAGAFIRQSAPRIVFRKREPMDQYGKRRVENIITHILAYIFPLAGVVVGCSLALSVSWWYLLLIFLGFLLGWFFISFTEWHAKKFL